MLPSPFKNNKPSTRDPRLVHISVLTPTHNRAHTLKRLYESLAIQQMEGIEWIVVDDGSTDETQSLLTELATVAAFPIKVIYQPNQGRHAALNRAIRAAAGRFSVFMDSDDWFSENALKTLLEAWHSIPPDQSHRFAGVAGLCAYPDGRWIGDSYPTNPLDSDFTEIRAVHRIRGDKKEMVRTELLLEHLFPIFPGERRVPTSWMLNRISVGFKARFFNDVVVYKEYQAGGMSATIHTIRMKSPLGSRLVYAEIVDSPRNLPLPFVLRAYVNLTRYSLHARQPLRDQLREVRSSWWWGLTFPVALGMFVRDLLRPTR